VIDPGEEPERVLGALAELGARCAAVLVTHAHLDHIGAVGAVAREATCPVYTSAEDAAVVADINAHLWPGFGPYVPHEPEGVLVPGAPLELAGMRIDVLATPGHHPGSVSLLLTGPDGSQVLASGDVLFAGSVGRTDLEGGDWDVLERSIALLIEACEPDTTVLPGHGPATTLRHELATNPFLAGLQA
jgi:glyoxylase-like metal-dependent hydrolase (beta-lactamase superfamily II)